MPALHAPGDSAALASEDARLLYRLPEPDLHGRTALVLSPLELLGRQTPGDDPADGDPGPDRASRGALDFDQSLPEAMDF